MLRKNLATVNYDRNDRVKNKQCPNCDAPVRGMEKRHFEAHFGRCRAKSIKEAKEAEEAERENAKKWKDRKPGKKWNEK